MAGAAKKPAQKKTVKHKELKNPLIAKGIRQLSKAKVSVGNFVHQRSKSL